MIKICEKNIIRSCQTTPKKMWGNQLYFGVSQLPLSLPSPPKVHKPPLLLNRNFTWFFLIFSYFELSPSFHHKDLE